MTYIMIDKDLPNFAYIIVGLAKFMIVNMKIVVAVVKVGEDFIHHRFVKTAYF